jgi:Flp pilus assembly protein CpaB
MEKVKQRWIAPVCAVFAAVCVAAFLWTQAQSTQQLRSQILKRFGGPEVKVLVARRTIEAGELIRDSMLEEASWVSLLLPDSVVKPQNRTRVVGHRASALILAGEPLCAERVFGQSSALADMGAGQTAVTLSTDAVHALGGELARGMKVSLMGALPDGRVEELAGKVAVLSADAGIARDEHAASDGSSAEEERGLLTGSSSAPSGSAISWVTLAIPDEQVKRILAAANTNTVYLVLPQEAEDL